MAKLTPQEEAQLQGYVQALGLIISADPTFLNSLYEKIVSNEEFSDIEKLGFAQIIRTFDASFQSQANDLKENIRSMIETELYDDFTKYGIPVELAPTVDFDLRKDMLELIQQQAVESGMRALATITSVGQNPNIFNIENLIPTGEE